MDVDEAVNQSLSDIQQLTRSAYLSGSSAEKWLGLIKLLIRRQVDGFSDNLLSSAICNTVLHLWNSFPGDAMLLEYLRMAISCDGLSVRLHHLLSSFLACVRNVELTPMPSNLDPICRLILSLHYESNSLPLGSLISVDGHLLFETLQQAIFLLRLSYECPPSPFHQLTVSASELLVLLLSCTGDFSSISAGQATLLLTDVHDSLQLVQLQAHVRQALESFLLNLSLLLGDGSKQAEEAAFFASFPITPGKQEGIEANPGLDIVAGTLLLQRLISHRASGIGSGAEGMAVAILYACYRSASTTLATFYVQTLMSAVSCLAEEPEDSGEVIRGFLWKSFIIGRLPLLLRRIRDLVALDQTSDGEAASFVPMQTAIGQLLTRMDILDRCESNPRVSVQAGLETVEEDSKTTGFRFDLLAALVAAGLLDTAFCTEALPSYPAEQPAKVVSEAQEFGTDAEVYIESKLSPETSIDETHTFLDRCVSDYRSHAILAEAIYKRFKVVALSSPELEGISRLCKRIAQHNLVLDLLSLHVSILYIVGFAAAFLEDYDFSSVGDPQTAISRLGDVILFLQSTLLRFNITASEFQIEDRTVRVDAWRAVSVLQSPEQMKESEKATLIAWHKALFDKNSEGIDDGILRLTRPQDLLRYAGLLVLEAIVPRPQRKLDPEVLKNGISFFLGPLLNWTLVGVIRALLDEFERINFASPVHLEILKTLLTDKNCPRVVTCMTGQRVVRILSDSKLQSLLASSPAATLHVEELIKSISRTLQMPFYTPPTPRVSWSIQPSEMVRQVLATASADKAPRFDLERCFTMLGVREFFEILFRESRACAALGKTDIARSFMAFVLSVTLLPHGETLSSKIPPLLPIFLHSFVPHLLRTIENQPVNDHALSIQLLGGVISSALTLAVNLEQALDKVAMQAPKPSVSCYTMVRRLRAELRKAKSGSVGMALFQKLSVSSSFVSTFPAFVSG